MKLLLALLAAASCVTLALAHETHGTRDAHAAQPAGAPGPASHSKAAGAAAPASAATDPRVTIARRIPGTKPEDVHETPIPGLYEVMRGTDAAFVSADGKYAIAGDLYDLRTNVDLTENQRREQRLKLIAQVPETDMVIFGPKSSRHTITVFTDVDCPYCRKLHSQIAEYNRLGIRVRYMFYPRTGPNTPSWTKAEEVWCSPNRKEALTEAKLGKTLNVKLCPNTPVAREYHLGQELDVQGTPSIVLANGDMFPGYVSPEDLAQALRTVAH